QRDHLLTGAGDGRVVDGDGDAGQDRIDALRVVAVQLARVPGDCLHHADALLAAAVVALVETQAGGGELFGQADGHDRSPLMRSDRKPMAASSPSWSIQYG